MENVKVDPFFSFHCGAVRVLVAPVSRTALDLVLWGREGGEEERELHRVRARRQEGVWRLEGRDYGREMPGASFGRRRGSEGSEADGFSVSSCVDALAVPGEVLELLALAAAEGWSIRHVFGAEYRYEDGDSGECHGFYAVGPDRGIHVSATCMEMGMGWDAGARAVTADELHREMGKLLALGAAGEARTAGVDPDSGILQISWTDRPAEEA
jgi:hypothetical protein